MLGFAPLTSVPLSSLPATGAQAATGFVSGSFGTPLAVYARTQEATGFNPTQFGTPTFGVSVQATGIPPGTLFGAPPKFGPVVTTLYGNGADGSATFADDSPYYWPVTRNGSIAVSTAQSRFGSGSIDLTGASTANNIAVAAHKLFNLSGAQFTLEAEVFLDAYNASGGRLLSSGGGASGWLASNGFHWLLQTTATGVSFDWLWYGFQGGYWGHYTKSLSVAVPLSAWNQIKVTCDGATVRIFLDGVPSGSLANPPITYGGSTTSAQDFRIGALTGEATGATNAANAYIQHIRLRRECTDTVAFSAPTAGLGRWIGELAGIAPTTQVPTPKVILTQQASGFSTTQFGTAFGQNKQRPTGFTTTQVGDPRIFPYSPPPINSTVFGTPRLFPFHVAPGIHGTQFGALAGWQHWNVAQSSPFVRFGTPTTPTDRTGNASGFAPVQFGNPVAIRHWPPNTDILCLARGFKLALFGKPVAQWDQAAQAQAIAPTVQFCAPRAFTTHHAESLAPSVQLGAPSTRTTHRVSGFKPVAFGLAGAILTQHATGLAPKARFGTPKTIRSNWYEVRGFCPFRAGTPRGYQRNNRRADGFSPVQFGTPAAFHTHRCTSIPPIARLGRPLLKRITQC